MSVSCRMSDRINTTSASESTVFALDYRLHERFGPKNCMFYLPNPQKPKKQSFSLKSVFCMTHLKMKMNIKKPLRSWKEITCLKRSYHELRIYLSSLFIGFSLKIVLLEVFKLMKASITFSSIWRTFLPTILNYPVANNLLRDFTVLTN